MVDSTGDESRWAQRVFRPGQKILPGQERFWQFLFVETFIDCERCRERHRRSLFHRKRLMGRIDYLPVGDAQSSRRAITASGLRRRARAVLGWVTFEPGLQSQLLEAEGFVRRLPRDADAAGMLRLAFLARDRELLDVALTSARAAERKQSG